MRRIRVFVLAGSLAVAAAPAPADAASQTFAGSIDSVWITARSVLISEGWDIAEEDRRLGMIITEPRNVDYRNFGVYGEGTRHRLKLHLRPAGPGQTSVTVDQSTLTSNRAHSLARVGYGARRSAQLLGEAGQAIRHKHQDQGDHHDDP